MNLEEEAMEWLSDMFDYPKVDLLEGLKYLGFIIKPNGYTQRDWGWILSKVEKISSLWCNKWLSKGGGLVLMKYVLEDIRVYWVTLTFIPKGLLE